MTNYSFKETINLFERNLKTEAPPEDVEEGVVDLVLDEGEITLFKGEQEGSFCFSFDLGMFLQSPDTKHLEELLTSNFLGVDTGGCTLALDEEVLKLKASTTPGTSPQENWEWLHRVVSVAHFWHDKLANWQEFTPLVSFKTEEKENAANWGNTTFKA